MEYITREPFALLSSRLVALPTLCDLVLKWLFGKNSYKKIIIMLA